MPKHVTRGGAHLRALAHLCALAPAHLRAQAPGRDSSEETSQRWRAVGDTVSNLTGAGSNPRS